MKDIRQKLDKAVELLKERGVQKAEVGIVLGTGLGGLVHEIRAHETIPYAEIPGFPISTVDTHDGKLIYGKLAGKMVLAMHGRFHYYEGYSMQQITFPLLVMNEFGIGNILISNAAGNLNPEWNKGELMLISDHINLLPENPLRGPNDDILGPRFPDMSRPYDLNMNNKLESIAGKEKISLRKGVYVSVQGPNLETAAEYRYLKIIGADAVGMSTVPEVLVANYLGIPVSAISVLTDDCDPGDLKPINIKEVIEIAGVAEKKLTFLFRELIREL